MQTEKNFFMVGAGNVAWHLSQALKHAGYTPGGVYSKHLANAEELARLLNCEAYDDLAKVSCPATLFFFSVKDDAIADAAAALSDKYKGKLFIHTAGSVAAEVFKGKSDKFGVIYPLQSFSKARNLNFREVPIYIEGNDSETERKIFEIAAELSDYPVKVLDSEHRKRMHLAAVFASNFANHCYACAENLLKDSGVDFSALLPLINETCKKVNEMPPQKAQTGPAVRYDRKIMEMQEKMLNGNMLAIYREMSKSIHDTAVKASDNEKNKQTI